MNDNFTFNFYNVISRNQADFIGQCKYHISYACIRIYCLEKTR